MPDSRIIREVVALAERSIEQLNACLDALRAIGDEPEPVQKRDPSVTGRAAAERRRIGAEMRETAATISAAMRLTGMSRPARVKAIAQRLGCSVRHARRITK